MRKTRRLKGKRKQITGTDVRFTDGRIKFNTNAFRMVIDDSNGQGWVSEQAKRFNSIPGAEGATLESIEVEPIKIKKFARNGRRIWVDVDNGYDE